MPTSAVASAGASLTPSPTIATLPAADLEPAHGVGLVGRQHLRRDLVDPEPTRDGVRNRLRIPGDHRDPHAHGVEALDRLVGLGSDLVLERERADERGRPTIT